MRMDEFGPMRGQHGNAKNDKFHLLKIGKILLLKLLRLWLFLGEISYMLC
jgi:hypothetical protein